MASLSATLDDLLHERLALRARIAELEGVMRGYEDEAADVAAELDSLSTELRPHAATLAAAGFSGLAWMRAEGEGGKDGERDPVAVVLRAQSLTHHNVSSLTDDISLRVLAKQLTAAIRDVDALIAQRMATPAAPAAVPVRSGERATASGAREAAHAAAHAAAELQRLRAEVHALQHEYDALMTGDAGSARASAPSSPTFDV
ncbi:hypothetical protein EON68_01945 [archaeon]|nr:MAG: hypothetical protein EON68_01945 [archaeon]